MVTPKRALPNAFLSHQKARVGIIKSEDRPLSVAAGPGSDGLTKGSVNSTPPTPERPEAWACGSWEEQVGGTGTGTGSYRTLFLLLHPDNPELCSFCSLCSYLGR